MKFSFRVPQALTFRKWCLEEFPKSQSKSWTTANAILNWKRFSFSLSLLWWRTSFVFVLPTIKHFTLCYFSHIMFFKALQKPITDTKKCHMSWKVLKKKTHLFTVVCFCCGLVNISRLSVWNLCNWSYYRLLMQSCTCIWLDIWPRYKRKIFFFLLSCIDCLLHCPSTSYSCQRNCSSILQNMLDGY